MVPVNKCYCSVTKSTHCSSESRFCSEMTQVASVLEERPRQHSQGHLYLYSCTAHIQMSLSASTDAVSISLLPQTPLDCIRADRKCAALFPVIWLQHSQSTGNRETWRHYFINVLSVFPHLPCVRSGIIQEGSLNSSLKLN